MTQTVQPLPQIGQWNGPEQLRDLQQRQLGRSLSWASRSPFYRNRFAAATPPSTFGDLADLPLTTKQDLRDAYPFGLLAVDRHQLATYHESSGTAGTPTASYYTAQDWVDVAERFTRKPIGILPSDTFLIRTPYAMMITAHMAHAGGRLAGATVVAGDQHSLVTPHARVVRVMRDLGVTLTWSLATECLTWVAAVRAIGLDPRAAFPALRGLFVGGEPLGDVRRQRISRLWGVPVINDYGSTETGGLAGECLAGRMHLWADRLVFEVHDPQTGLFSTDGCGQLVVTTLYREAMPLIRYNLEDTVEVDYSECDCGWALPTVRVLGRSASGYSVAGTTVTQHRLDEIIFSLPEEYDVLFWRARTEAQMIEIEIEVAQTHRVAAVVALTAALEQQLGMPCHVVAVETGTLIPIDILTRGYDEVKPRRLFSTDEDWSMAILRH